MNGKQVKRLNRLAEKTSRGRKQVREWWKRLNHIERGKARKEMAEHLGIR